MNCVSAMASRPFYLPGPKGQRLCIYHPPQGSAQRGWVLYVHPFAEEMNRSRRMAALQARALAEAGFAVLQPDLLGCGDSSGDFADASWEDWISDVVRSAQWLLEQRRIDQPTNGPQMRLWLWGLRAGCLLCQQAAQHLQEPCNFLYWQPPWSGRVVLQQFLRLHQACALLSGARSGASESLLAQLEQGRTVEVAGYCLPAALAQGLLSAQLCAPSGALPPQRVEWFEMTCLQPHHLTPMSAQARQAWCTPTLRTVRHGLSGPAFWQSHTTEHAPDLVAATTAALCSELP